MIKLEIALAGLLGTVSMVFVMALIHRWKLANADMIRAIGSLFTHSLDNSFFPGLLIHFVNGIAFAFLYALFIGHAPQIGPLGACVLGTLLGVAHGLWVGLFLVVEVAEHHPLQQFRDAGFGVAVAHCIGHISYGFTVGLVIALNWATIQPAVLTFSLGPALADFIGYVVVWVPMFGAPLTLAAYVAYTGYLAWRKRA